MSIEEMVAQVEGYVAKWQPVLGLQNWQIDVRPDGKAKKGTFLQIVWSNHYRSCAIWVSDLVQEDEDARNLALSRMEQATVHELVHLLLAEPWDFNDDNFVGSLYDAGRMALENATDIVTNLCWRLAR